MYLHIHSAQKLVKQAKKRVFTLFFACFTSICAECMCKYIQIAQYFTQLQEWNQSFLSEIKTAIQLKYNFLYNSQSWVSCVLQCRNNKLRVFVSGFLRLCQTKTLPQDSHRSPARPLCSQSLHYVRCCNSRKKGAIERLFSNILPFMTYRSV